MRKVLAFSLVFIIALGFAIITGCDDNKTSPNTGTPGDGGPAFIELRASQTMIRGFTGEVRQVQVTAITRDVQGVAVPGAKIAFAILNPQPYKGTISTAAADTATNDNGQLLATYTVNIERTTDVVIEARSGNVTNRITLSIQVVNDILGTLTIEAERRVLAVPPNQTRQTTVTATLVDTAGRALSAMQVGFRTNPPGMGSVDSDTGVTDINGRTSRKFTSIVNKYGFCEVIAQVGDQVGTVTIEVRTVAAPAFLVVRTPTPTVTSASGVDVPIDIEAIVSDSLRVGVPSIPIAFEVVPMVEGGQSFGTISARDTTDMDGKVSTVFRSLGGFGRQKVRARVLPTGGESAESEVVGEVTIEIKRLDVGIRSLILTANPNFMSLPADSIGQAVIRALVLDERNLAIPNVQVDYTTDLGALSRPTLTDSSGYSTCQFSVNRVSGIAHIYASIPGTNLSATTNIDIRTQDELTGSLLLRTDIGFIYADNGLTYANLTATLKDADNMALAGKTVVFTSRHGSVNPQVTTDSLGIARAIFTDIGLPSVDEAGNIVPAVITARYDQLGLQAQVEVTIRERNPVSNITLQAAAQQMIAGRSDSTVVRAVCFLASGAYAPNGTLVRFLVDNGRFTQETIPVSGNFGVAETFYIAGNTVGTATLTASVTNPDTVVTSNEVQIRLLAGPPSRVTVTANPRSIPTNDPSVFSELTALVTDTVGNPVSAGTLVRFSTTMGNVSPVTSITDTTGRAISRLYSGVSAGVAEVMAEVTVAGGTISGTNTVTFIAGNPNTIQLTADPLQISVAGTGGNETSTLRATIRDPNGNLVEAATTVVFQLLREPPPPAGCNINQRGAMDSTTTAAGVGVVSLNSGTQIGGKLIRAYTWRDPQTRLDTVQVVLSTVAVVAGPPFQLDLDVNNDGDDAGGGAWVVEVSARVWDIYRNPVANNIPVVFTVEPEIANISPGHTGNNGRRGVPTQGLAYADMVYNSVNTFDDITISAEVQTVNGLISGSREHKLPLQDGVLELNVDPANWMFDRNRPNDIGSHRVWVVLRDGHQILINKGPILFTTNRARFYWYDYQGRRYVEYFPDPARKLTGIVDARNNELPGQATVYLRGIMDDYFLDPFTLEVTVQVQASVEGYNDVQADPGFIFMTRH